MHFDPIAKVSVEHPGGASEAPPSRTAAEDLLAEELARCCDCGRTPLIGEHVHLYESADLVCELCRMLRSDAPVLSAQVTHRLGSSDRSDPAVVVRVSRL
ncbi:MAG TPA: hypothetical protein VHM72_09805 [Solirubrobacteraceae bacterium]|nr:hypothetical protein [Solirubrobacteraceae bacterium]